MKDFKFDKELYLDDPNFVESFKEAIGYEDGDTVEIITPQFNRCDGIKTPKFDQEIFNKLKSMNKDQLIEAGMINFDGELWLFPFEWFDFIPEGFEVKTILGDTKNWNKSEMDNDMRFGALAYGIVPDYVNVDIA